ncbi:hypothetical protein DFH08DRAFT_828007 [Mycena albidolilacea]|uniref:Uncharacterized protein n=1 Tax=Mycena albidolilacea TaxID=1033008 RepID=A0AAD7E6S1_9AGAR|nr:hypothetical protein DFH08DRAFT_828007 [Mycena albidolilacea]
MTGKREGHPRCGLHVSDEGVGGVGGKTGYLLLHSYWIAFDRVGVWIKLTLVKQRREEGGAGTPPVAGHIQGVGGVGGRTGYLLLPIYWSAFDGDGIQVVQEGGRRSEHPLLQATLVSEVLEAEQYRKARCRGHPRRRPYLNYNGGNVPGIAGNKVGNGGQPQDTIYPDGDL